MLIVTANNELDSKISNNKKSDRLAKPPHQRSIRSFVCRNTKLPQTKEQLYENLWPLYGVEGWQSKQLISPASLFINPADLILEIGFGTGKTLFEMAKNHPENNFIGIEVYRPGIVSLLSFLEQHPLTNLKLFCGDATEVLQRIENATLTRVQIFFPDPWPKSRHRKRRLIQPHFVAELAPKLQLGGSLHLATDWEDYAVHMMKVMSANVQFVNIQQGQKAYAPRPSYRPLTKYECRGTRLGHIARDLIFERV